MYSNRRLVIPPESSGSYKLRERCVLWDSRVVRDEFLGKENHKTWLPHALKGRIVGPKNQIGFVNSSKELENSDVKLKLTKNRYRLFFKEAELSNGDIYRLDYEDLTLLKHYFEGDELDSEYELVKKIHNIDLYQAKKNGAFISLNSEEQEFLETILEKDLSNHFFEIGNEEDKPTLLEPFAFEMTKRGG